MNHASYRVAGILLLALCAALPAHAQDERKSEISGGYQLLTLHEGEIDETLGTGWYADVAGNFGPIFAVVVQVAGNYKSYGQDETINGFRAVVDAQLKVHTYLAGIRRMPSSWSAARPHPSTCPARSRTTGRRSSPTAAANRAPMSRCRSAAA